MVTGGRRMEILGMIDQVLSLFQNHHKVDRKLVVPFVAVLLAKQAGGDRSYFGKDSEVDTSYLGQASGKVDNSGFEDDSQSWPSDLAILEFLHAASHLKVSGRAELRPEWINEAVAYTLWTAIPQDGPGAREHKLRLLAGLGPFIAAYDALIPNP